MGMSEWNYRVFREVVEGEENFFVAEAYYDQGQVVVRSEPIAPQGESRFALGRIVGLYARAFAFPVLDAASCEGITGFNVDEVISTRKRECALHLP